MSDSPIARCRQLPTVEHREQTLTALGRAPDREETSRPRVRCPGTYPSYVSSTQSGIGQSCAFCGSHGVVWVHPLAEDLVGYREYGKGHTLPSFWALCERCEGVYRTGDVDAAVEVMRSSAWSGVEDDDVAECIRKPLAVLRRADLGPRRFDPEPSAVVEARRRGFVPLRELTGVAEDLGPLSPAEHVLWLEALGAVIGEEGYDAVHDRWLVRSPWRPLSARQAVSALWRWVDQQGLPTPRSLAEYHPLVVEFFSLSESAVMAFVTGSGS
jgi:hypothetical protein